MRLRRTAPPTLRVTVTPRRSGAPSPRSKTKTVKKRVVRRAPRRVASRKSPRRIRRLIALRGSAMRWRSLLPLRHPRERVTTFRAARREHTASTLRAHSRAEPVVAGAAKAMRLKGAFHGRLPRELGPPWGVYESTGSQGCQRSGRARANRSVDEMRARNLLRVLALLRAALI